MLSRDDAGALLNSTYNGDEGFSRRNYFHYSIIAHEIWNDRSGVRTTINSDRTFIVAEGDLLLNPIWGDNTAKAGTFIHELVFRFQNNMARSI